MLLGKGFNDVINVAGGIRAWDGHVAVGPEELGLELLTGRESMAETLAAAYSLEAGLQDFYLTMTEKVTQDDIRQLFQKLAKIESVHQDRIFDAYLQISPKPVSREAFEKDLVKNAVEGGLTTDEYIQMFTPDWESPVDIISLAMSIEAQALDLYTRAAVRNKEPRSAAALRKIAEEERAHLAQLGRLMDERM